MSDEFAKPGDIIEITWSNPRWLGKKLTVVEVPQEMRGRDNVEPGNAWFLHKCGVLYFFRKDLYKIVERKGESKDLNRDVDKFLDDQRDAIFRGLV